MDKKKEIISEKKTILFLYIFLELSLIFLIFSFHLIPIVFGGVGGNVTVITQLQVGEVAPEVLNVTLDNYSSSVILIANSTKQVVCEVLVRDFNNDSTFSNVRAVFFNSSTSSFGASDDNNSHYTNSSCPINTSFVTWNGIADTNYTALANCSFNVYYYADPGSWNCTALVNDTVNLSANGTDSIDISELLAVGLPDTINYGIVNSTYVSNESTANVTNFGNVQLDLALHGYGATDGDNLSMNCTLGNVQNISVQYEKYNLTISNPGALSLSQFEVNYTNLTGNITNKEFNLNRRQNDSFNEAFNSTYWRIYVPVGVAGSCTGNIVFGAVKST